MKLIIDFDSTFVKSESLCDLAEIALRGNPEKENILKKIIKITNLGMEGKISFPESLQRRFDILLSRKEHISELVEFLKNNISDSFLKNKIFFQKNSKDILIISGGFRDFIVPVVADFGIEAKNVLANDFVFDKNGNIIGFGKNNPLAQENGKVEQVKMLGLEKEAIIIGDGWTDFQIKQAGAAKYFIAFVENISREKVIANADFVAKSFDDVLNKIKNQNGP